MGGAISDLPRRWRATLNTAESIRTGLPQAKVDFSGGSEEELEGFLRAITPGTVAAARELVDRYDFSSCRTLADVGGGSGALAMVIAEEYPGVRATVIDLPTVTPIARRIIRESAAADRIDVAPADAVAGPIPGAYDVAVLRALIQVLSPDDVVPMLRNVYAVLNPGGVVLELKFTNSYPFWVANMLGRVEVIRRGVCKYVICARAAGISLEPTSGSGRHRNSSEM
ncbi:MAG: methyltransferase [Planctomycetes bacterium]|nr:methyltransferase [Planctomycetota bacterium]